jgi:hypothetical protein
MAARGATRDLTMSSAPFLKAGVTLAARHADPLQPKHPVLQVTNPRISVRPRVAKTTRSPTVHPGETTRRPPETQAGASQCPLDRKALHISQP